MRKHPLAPAFALALVLAGCAPSPDGEADHRDIAATANAIIGGSVDNGHPAVALLYNDAIGSICSGTLIDSRTYLTAAHCIGTSNPDDYFIIGVTDIDDDPDWVAQASDVTIHPQYDPNNSINDVGIVELTSTPPVKPFRWQRTNGGVYESGTEFTAIGYGDSNGNGGGAGTKRKVDLEIVDVYSDLFTYGDQDEGVCFGDSGGPDVIVDEDGYYTVIGVHSFVLSGNCDDLGASMRTDDTGTFIDNFAPSDAGTARVSSGGGGGGGSGCSVSGNSSAHSPLGFAALSLLALVGIARRKRARFAR